MNEPAWKTQQGHKNAGLYIRCLKGMHEKTKVYLALSLKW